MNQASRPDCVSQLRVRDAALRASLQDRPPANPPHPARSQPWRRAGAINNSGFRAPWPRARSCILDRSAPARFTTGAIDCRPIGAIFRACECMVFSAPWAWRIQTTNRDRTGPKAPWSLDRVRIAGGLIFVGEACAAKKTVAALRRWADALEATAQSQTPKVVAAPLTRKAEQTTFRGATRFRRERLAIKSLPKVPAGFELRANISHAKAPVKLAFRLLAISANEVPAWGSPPGGWHFGSATHRKTRPGLPDWAKPPNRHDR